MTQDLTKITAPLGLLDAETQQALCHAFFMDQLEVQLYNRFGQWEKVTQDQSLHRNITYRVKPEPVTVSNWWNIYTPDALGFHHTRERADRKAVKIELQSCTLTTLMVS
jgi:hypothetical protein